MNQEYLNQDGQIDTQQQGRLGVITLNRPEALNALSLEMIRQIATILKRWENDGSVSAVLFLGAGERAFCAGGDVKSFHSAGMDYRRGHVNLKVPSLFFAEEYSLNKQIFEYPKPTIAVMDGITMGGGYGVAGNCKHRIATGNTVFAMPEVSIGFFPDVGSVYHLNKAPQNFGRYLALVGAHIKAGDMLAAGLADGYVEAARIGALREALAGGEVESVLAEFYGDHPKAQVFDDSASHINEAFGKHDVLEICAALRQIGSVWAMDTLDRLLSRAPLSVMVSAEHLKRMEGKEFSDVITADFQVAQRFIEYPDLYEGIRAALIDKDQKPIWEPAQLDEVKPEEIGRYFEPTGYELGDVEIFAA